MEAVIQIAKAKEEKKSVQSNVKSILGGSIGNLVEWYDWYSYSAFAIYFSSSFFPTGDQTAQLLNTAGIFAVGFLMRPIGGWLFGSIADKIGRKKAMTYSVLLMSFGSLLIAIAPTYKAIGIAAPIILLLARLLQGLSVGGEYGIAATYLSEMATSNRRGFYSSIQYITLIGGQLLALALLLVLQNWILSEIQLETWGWRIPFIIGAVLSIIGLYLRKSLKETDAFINKKDSQPGVSLIKKLMKYPKEVFVVMGLTIGGTLGFYTYTTYMQKFLVNSVHLTKQESTWVSFFTLIFFALLQPFFGNLSDKIGRKPLLLYFGILGTIFTVPLLTAIENTQSMVTAVLLICIALAIISGYTAISAIVKAEMFPAEIRAIGVSLPYALAVTLFGGTAEYFALWFKKSGVEQYYYWYVTACIFLSLVVYISMPDTSKTSKINEEEESQSIES